MIDFLTLPVWAYAAYSDLQTRRAANWIWLVLLCVAVIQLIHTGEASLAYLLITIPVVYPGTWILYDRNLIGGADAKAFFVVPLLYPMFTPFILVVATLWALPWAFYTGERDIPLLVPLASGVATVVLCNHLLLFSQVS